MKSIGNAGTLTVLTLAVLACLLFLCSQVQAQTQLQMPLGGVQGSYYMTGAPVAKYVNEHSDKIRVTPNTSGGGVENIRRVSPGVAHLGMATAMEMYKSWNGLDPFKKQMRDWRTIGVSTKVLLNHVATLAKYNIKTIEDVKGRIFAIGAPGSAAAASMLEFLEFTGLDKDITMRKLPHKDYPTMLLDGKIDGEDWFPEKIPVLSGGCSERWNIQGRGQGCHVLWYGRVFYCQQGCARRHRL